MTSATEDELLKKYEETVSKSLTVVNYNVRQKAVATQVGSQSSYLPDENELKMHLVKDVDRERWVRGQADKSKTDINPIPASLAFPRIAQHRDSFWHRAAPSASPSNEATKGVSENNDQKPKTRP